MKKNSKKKKKKTKNNKKTIKMSNYGSNKNEKGCTI